MSRGLNRPDAPLDEVVTAFVRVGASQRHWVRLLIWQALSGERNEGEADYRRSMVDDLRRRQADGEIAADLDPACLQLALFGAALAPVLLTQFAEDLTGLPADSAEFQERYLEQLRRIVARLGQVSQATPSPSRSRS